MTNTPKNWRETVQANAMAANAQAFYQARVALILISGLVVALMCWLDIASGHGVAATLTIGAMIFVGLAFAAVYAAAVVKVVADDVARADEWAAA